MNEAHMRMCRDMERTFREARGMTREEWEKGDDAHAMLQWCAPKLSPRKLRLFACACARLRWQCLGPEYVREAVRVAEAYADGHTSLQRLKAARNTCRTTSGADVLGRWVCLRDPEDVADHCVRLALRNAPGEEPRRLEVIEPKRFAHALRDITGDLFAPWVVPGDLWPGGVSHMAVANKHTNRSVLCPVFEPNWLTPDVLALARAAYSERRSDGSLDGFCLGQLSDALEDAGCGQSAVLAPLREPRGKFRGFWLVDLILGKE